LTLGILLEEISGFALRRVGSGNRMTFTHNGEQCLDLWMATNAHVCWVEHSTPWTIERDLLEAVSLPLNIQDNRHHGFSAALSLRRSEAKRRAREKPIAQKGNQRRSGSF
jgi:hypothetical protein